MKKRFSPLMTVHLLLTGVLIISSAVAAVTFIGKLAAASGSERGAAWMHLLLTALILTMLGTGLLYLLQRYGKQAAKLYKAFLLLQVGVTVVTIAINLGFSAPSALLFCTSFLYACKAAILLLLACWKDLGKDRTWLLFCFLLALDAGALLLALVHMAGNGFDVSFMGYVTALIADGTTGLAIRGKYADKARRRTI